ncbi:MAG: sigma-54 dependent transcriptional regulator [candidate division KSB1 bacterium]|nr:sigma-54 dependent transcriptional regulator [candidate division KSB1 bacterium]MDZ7302490.1 sigma-54 dependent transcriptional regulator [candidate division KSB1 bacterium]MDZ7311914.1 sigma-54 dependent transcriptional regulator [candidate division KSB1 bacterium]
MALLTKDSQQNQNPTDGQSFSGVSFHNPSSENQSSNIPPLREEATIPPDAAGTFDATGAAPPKRRVLLIDDDLNMHEFCRHYLEKAGYEFLSARSGVDGLELIRQGAADLILLDFMMPDKDGYSIFKELMTNDDYRHVRHVPVVMLTAYADHNRKRDLIEMGLKMHLVKPFGGQELIKVIESVYVTSEAQERMREQERLQLEKAHEETLMLRTLLRETCTFDNIVGTNARMKEIFEKVKKVARTDANIMIYGESGTGKELIARSIHAHSPRAKGPFIPVDCVALPGNLLESELFGYEKGAFTGAYASKRGLLELANEGTFFLDEICELNLDLQAKLLRVLQERQFRRIGGKDLINVNIRVISATNRDPLNAVKEKRLRHDLYYRLNVIPIYLPPLRERRDDIPLLAQSFLRKFCGENDRQIMRFSDEAMKRLMRYSWPGNVRELQNVVERMVSLADGRIVGVEDLPDYLREEQEPAGSDGFSIPTDLSLREARKRWMETFEKKYLIELLNRYNGNISRVARKAGVHRMTIYRMLKQYHITIRTAIDKS